MDLGTLIKQFFKKEEVQAPKDYPIAFCRYENILDGMIRECGILHRDCPHQEEYDSCKYYKQERRKESDKRKTDKPR